MDSVLLQRELLTSDVQVAARALHRGRLVGLPTETVYGLAADADHTTAVQRIFTVKGRPTNHPVIVHVADAGALDSGPHAWARDVPDYAHTLAHGLWPGPLTLILPRSERAADAVTGGLPHVGIRCPAHPLAQAVLHAFADLSGRPHAGIAAPSANRFGRVSPTTASHVLTELAASLQPGLDVVLDGGPSAVGVESTIVDCTGPFPAIVRSGAISSEQISELTELPVAYTSAVLAPGTLPSHYSPQAQVTLVTSPAAAKAQALRHTNPVGFIALADVSTPPRAIRLAAPISIEDYAHVLYTALRAADDYGLAHVLAIAPPGTSALALACTDRLARAAHPRASTS